MRIPVTLTSQMTNLLDKKLYAPIHSSEPQGWENILVEEFCQPPGEGKYENLTEHTLCISLNHRPSCLFQEVNSRQHNSPCLKGDICIVPIGLPFFWRWRQEDQYLRIRIAPDFLQQVVQEAAEITLDEAKLLPEFRIRNPRIEQLGELLLDEIKNGGLAGGLYAESITNALAIQLLRHISEIQLCTNSYGATLSDRQLLQVIDYINDCLEQDIRLSDLAGLLRMSKFQFSRRFKQSMGITPHQYVLRQRIERAKHLLKETNLPVMQIAMLCGFSSHSHLGKLILQHTGLSPRAYRIS